VRDAEQRSASRRGADSSEQHTETHAGSPREEEVSDAASEHSIRVPEDAECELAENHIGNIVDI